MRIAIGLEYDGRGFCGWQSQPSGCSVQDALERGLSQVAGSTVRVVGAGRTDAGVHASAQVAHFDPPDYRPMQAWVRGTNSALPAGIAVLWAKQATEGFHARYSATARAYTYLLLNREVRLGLERGRVGWFHRPLDLRTMQQAAAAIVGCHDFSAFRSVQCVAKSPVRDMREIAIERRGDLVVFRFVANAFLHRMVRNIVGSLIYVGKGRYPVEWLGEVLASRDRARAAPTFAPDGLYLSAVEYDRQWAMPQTLRAASLFDL